MASIVVCGSLLSRPSCERFALHLQYLVGLRRLGHRVLYVEEHSGQSDSAATATGGRLTPPAGLALLRDVLRSARVDVPVVWVDPDSGLIGGIVSSQLRRYMADADLLLDIGGHSRLAERRLPRRRALIALDEPAGDGQPSEHDHDLHFSFESGPDRALDVDWVATLPPILPRLWYGPAARPGMPVEVITELGAGSGSHAREDFGLRFLLGLPSRSSLPLRLGLAAEAEDGLRERFVSAGWEVRVQGSQEASLAGLRRQVIGAQSGLCLLGPSASCGHRALATVRSACLLAAGRPLVLWDPARISGLPVGAGAIEVEVLEDAGQVLDRLSGALAVHSGGARDLAARFLDYRVVLPSLLAQALPRDLSAVA